MAVRAGRSVPTPAWDAGCHLRSVGRVARVGGRLDECRDLGLVCVERDGRRLLGKTILTWLTPGTLSRDFFTVTGHSSQVMFCTWSVVVCGVAARAANGDSATSSDTTDLRIGSFKETGCQPGLRTTRREGPARSRRSAAGAGNARSGAGVAGSQAGCWKRPEAGTRPTLFRSPTILRSRRRSMPGETAIQAPPMPIISSTRRHHRTPTADGGAPATSEVLEV